MAAWASAWLIEPFSAAAARLKSSLVACWSVPVWMVPADVLGISSVSVEPSSVPLSVVPRIPPEGEADLAAVRRHAGRGVLAV